MKRSLFAIFAILLIFTPIRTYAVEAGTAVGNVPQLQSETAILMDAATGQILYQKDINEKMYPASITKIMTGMLALKNSQLTDIITMSYDAVFSIDRDSSHVALDVDEQVTLEQAMYALSIESANDAANGIAELVGGSMERFVSMMNNAAKEIGAENTNFVNAHGLFDENHYTTAYDMAKITAAAIKVPGFTDFFSATYFEVPPTNKQPDTRYFRNANKMLNGEIPYDGIIMSKTGWTTESQNTLITVAQRDETTLIAVVMKSSISAYKWDDTVQLLDYGFSQFYRTELSLSQIAPQLKIDAKSELSEPRAISLLLPSGTNADELSAHLDGSTSQVSEDSFTIPLCLQLKNPVDPEDDLLETQVTISSIVAVSDQNKRESDEVSGNLPESKPRDSSPIALIVLLVVGGVAAVIFVFRLRVNYLRRQRRKRRRKRQIQERRNEDIWML